MKKFQQVVQRVWFRQTRTSAARNSVQEMERADEDVCRAHNAWTSAARRIAVVAAVGLMIVAGSVKAEQWSFDKAHTSVVFSVKHMVVSNVRGEFTDFDGTINFDGKDVSKGSAEMTIQTASVSTNNERRDGHLKSADFFDVEKYPTMTFKSTKVVPGEGGKFQLVGDMTIKDVTKPVTFDCEYLGSVEAMGHTKAGFSAETTINRKDFHIMWSKTLDSGGLVAGDDVKISLEIEANKAAEKM